MLDLRFDFFERGTRFDAGLVDPQRFGVKLGCLRQHLYPGANLAANRKPRRRLTDDALAGPMRRFVHRQLVHRVVLLAFYYRFTRMTSGYTRCLSHQVRTYGRIVKRLPTRQAALAVRKVRLLSIATYHWPMVTRRGGPIDTHGPICKQRHS